MGRRNAARDHDGASQKATYCSPMEGLETRAGAMGLHRLVDTATGAACAAPAELSRM